MKSRLKIGSLVAILWLGLVGWAIPARAESFARISDVQGLLNIRGGETGGWTPATLNLLLQQDDQLETGAEATAEIEMPALARIQMGGRTHVVIREYGDSDRRDEVILEKGGIFVDDRNGTTAIETLSAAISPDSGSVVRVDTDRDGTRVRVKLGSAQVQMFEDGQYSARPLLLRTGEEMVLDVSARPQGPYVYQASNDTLDRYASRREVALGRAGGITSGSRSLEQPLMGSEELDNYGEWVNASGTTVWRPRVAVDWRPYSYGYWAWYDPYGWTWISYEPFGYTTFHYGAWNYLPAYGWCWYPGYVWRPAYVSWVSVGPYYGWAPLTPWGTVVSITNVTVVNRIDQRVFTVAPRTAFVVDQRAFRNGRGRIIPAEMTNNRVVRVADKRVFADNRRVERIKDINSAQPVRVDRRVHDEKRKEIAGGRADRSVRSEIPETGRSSSRGLRADQPARSNASPDKGIERSRSSQKYQGASGRRDLAPQTRNLPPVGRADKKSRDSVRGGTDRRDMAPQTRNLPPVSRADKKSRDSVRGGTDRRDMSPQTQEAPQVDRSDRRSSVPQDRSMMRPRGGKEPKLDGSAPQGRSSGRGAYEEPKIERRSAPAPGAQAPNVRRGPDVGRQQPAVRQGEKKENPGKTNRSWFNRQGPSGQ